MKRITPPKLIQQRVISKLEEDGYAYRINKTQIINGVVVLYILCSNKRKDKCDKKKSNNIRGWRNNVNRERESPPPTTFN